MQGCYKNKKTKTSPSRKTLELEAPCLESGPHNGTIWVLEDSGSPTPHGFFLRSPSLCTCVCFLCSCPTVLPSLTPCITIAIQTLTTTQNLRPSLQGIWPYCAWPDLNGGLPPWHKPAGVPVKPVLWRLSCMGLCVLTWGNTPAAIGQGSPSVAFSVYALSFQRHLHFFLKVDTSGEWVESCFESFPILSVWSTRFPFKNQLLPYLLYTAWNSFTFLSSPKRPFSIFLLHLLLSL